MLGLGIVEQSKINSKSESLKIYYNIMKKEKSKSKTVKGNPEGIEMYEKLFGEEFDGDLTGLREFTINHLFANLWSRSEKSIDENTMITLRERSMITVALLTSQGRNEQLESHIKGALNIGITKEKINEIMIHVAHYAGWAAGNNGEKVLSKVLQK